jgi:hypothetical protein
VTAAFIWERVGPDIIDNSEWSAIKCKKKLYMLNSI